MIARRIWVTGHRRGPSGPARWRPRCTGSRTSRTMRLEFLADRPEFIMSVAIWICQEWREEFATVGLDAWLAEFRATLMRDGIPTTFVASEGPGLLGTASLIASDLPERPELSPWMASVYVLPRYRRTGIATALIGRVLAQASWLGMEQVYLQTATKVDFY